MPCITDHPAYDYNAHIQKMLCQACSFLSNEKMHEIHSEDIIYGSLLEWYITHLAIDLAAAHKEDNQCLVTFLEGKLKGTNEWLQKQFPAKSE